MGIKKYVSIIIAGAGAGIINGLFGAGGGMVLVPLLSGFTELEEDEVFPASVCIILPICLVSLIFSPWPASDVTENILIYMLGSAAGGVLAGTLGRKIPTIWLHRSLGVLILWGGIRYLC